MGVVLKKDLKHWKDVILFIAVTAVSLLLVFHDFSHHVWYSGDTFRDIAVGYHIAVFHEYPIVGHKAGGLNFYYPPYYYYLVALVTRINSNIWFVTGVFAFSAALFPGIIYLLTTHVFDRLVGVTAAILYLMLMLRIGSMNLWSVFVAMHFSYFALILISFDKHKKLKYCGYFLFALALAMNYADIVILPFIVLYEYISSSTKYNIITSLGFLLLSSVLLQVPIIIHFGLVNVLIHILPSAHLLLSEAYVSAIGKSWLYIGRELFHHSSLFSLTGGIASVTLSLTTLVYHKNMLKRVVFVAAFFVGAVFVGSFYQRGAEYWYYYPLFPLFIICISFLSIKLWRTQNMVAKYISCICMIVFILSVTGEFTFPGGSDTHDKVNSIIRTIYTKAPSLGIKNDAFVLSGSLGDGIYDSPTFWYMAEIMRHRKLSYLTNSEEGILAYHLGEYPVFLVCKNEGAAATEQCLDPFLAEYKKYSLSKILPYSSDEYRIYLLVPN